MCDAILCLPSSSLSQGAKTAQRVNAIFSATKPARMVWVVVSNRVSSSQQTRQQAQKCSILAIQYIVSVHSGALLAWLPLGLLVSEVTFYRFSSTIHTINRSSKENSRWMLIKWLPSPLPLVIYMYICRYKFNLKHAQPQRSAANHQIYYDNLYFHYTFICSVHKSSFAVELWYFALY